MKTTYAIQPNTEIKQVNTPNIHKTHKKLQQNTIWNPLSEDQNTNVHSTNIIKFSRLKLEYIKSHIYFYTYI